MAVGRFYFSWGNLRDSGDLILILDQEAVLDQGKALDPEETMELNKIKTL